MNSHKTKAESVVRNEAVRIVADKDDVRVIKSNLKGVAELSISEDDDAGGDPYNSTGQHVIIKLELDSQD